MTRLQQKRATFQLCQFQEANTITLFICLDFQCILLYFYCICNKAGTDKKIHLSYFLILVSKTLCLYASQSVYDDCKCTCILSYVLYECQIVHTLYTLF